MKLVLKFLLAIAVLLVATNAHPLCDYLDDDHAMSQSDFAQGTEYGQWIEGQFDEWKESNGTGTNTKGFYDFFARKFVPHLSHSIRDCDGRQECSPTNCEALNEKFEVKEQYFAWSTLESMVNFNNARLKIKTLENELFSELTAGMDGLISDYSDVDNLVAITKTVNARHKRRTQLAGGILLIIRSELSILGTAFAGTPVGQVGNVLALLLSGYNLGVSMYNDNLPDASGLPRKLNQLLSKLQATNHKMAREMYALDTKLIMGGNKGLLGMTLVDVIQTGAYREPLEISQKLQNDIYDLKYASALSNIWDQENVHIIMAPASGGCENDNRAHGKVCLNEWPNYVFYPQFTSNLGDYHKKRRSMVRLFPGHYKIPKDVGISMKDVVQSSVAIFEDHGNEDVHLQGVEAFEQFLDPASKSYHHGGKFAGIFAIPVCYQPDGFGISSINMKNGRNYPCFCGTPPTSDAASSEHLTDNRLAARQSHNHYSDTTWRYDEGQTFAFLNSTGLYRSRNWWEVCKHDHGMHCEEDMSVSWRGRFPPGTYSKLQHPFSVCRGHPHSWKGCEKPYNNGLDQNEHCSGDHAVAAASYLDDWDGSIDEDDFMLYGDSEDEFDGHL
ncbi:unnamed protein product [Aureobasidium uvarum]|uniref:Uncharacterized protein n=1 Tax=Aureobasidium uvarum TaxID=2773716 RepID=A0A9N8KQH5_9PEZI|nr:unnamed protein product [Aureobasidium uvarum]